jgi:hypothetical protein
VHTHMQALLASGLFARAAPLPYPPAADQGPMYVGDRASGAVRQVNAMGRLAFQVQPQTLPAVSDAQVMVDPAVASLLLEPLPTQLQHTAAAVLSSGVAQGASTLQIVCEVRVLKCGGLPLKTHGSFRVYTYSAMRRTSISDSPLTRPHPS